jgi:NTP pyrophosphatase (non-canonical NTP hydrolase)
MDLKFEILKLAEEATELSEVCIKAVTKEKAVNDELIDKLVEEMGDVIARIHCTKKAIRELTGVDISERVMKRAEEKRSQIENYSVHKRLVVDYLASENKILAQPKTTEEPVNGTNSN